MSPLAARRPRSIVLALLSVALGAWALAGFAEDRAARASAASFARKFTLDRRRPLELAAMALERSSDGAAAIAVDAALEDVGGQAPPADLEPGTARAVDAIGELARARARRRTRADPRRCEQPAGSGAAPLSPRAGCIRGAGAHSCDGVGHPTVDHSSVAGRIGGAGPRSDLHVPGRCVPGELGGHDSRTPAPERRRRVGAGLSRSGLRLAIGPGRERCDRARRRTATSSGRGRRPFGRPRARLRGRATSRRPRDCGPASTRALRRQRDLGIERIAQRRAAGDLEGARSACLAWVDAILGLGI